MLAHSPRIVTNGLVVCLDSGNYKSYPRSGASWTNLINKETFTITGNYTPETEFGSINLNGGYMNFTAPNLGTITTVEMWCKMNNMTNTMPFGWNNYDVWTGATGQGLGFNTASSDLYGIDSTQVTNLGLLNNWKHYVYVMNNSDLPYTNNKMYINGQMQTLSQVLGAGPGSQGFNSGNGRIACWLQDTSYVMPMNLRMFNVYNRALTATEIQQNFNAHRGRFGI
jgi:hypothetical protein